MEPQPPAHQAHRRIAQRLHQVADGILVELRVGVGEHQDVALRQTDEARQHPRLPRPLAARQLHAPRRVVLHDPVRPVGRRIGPDQDLQVLGGVVLR